MRDDLKLDEGSRVTLKLAFHEALLLLQLVKVDAGGIWVDPYNFQHLINGLPVAHTDETFTLDTSGYRPMMYIPFTQVQFMLKEQEA
jgi:hypothetical protein